MKSKRKILGASIAALIAAPSISYADTIALGILEIKDLTFTGSVSGLLDVTDFRYLTIADSGLNTASFDGAGAFTGGYTVTDLSGYDPNEACSGPDCSTGENDYTKLLFPTASLTSADSRLKDTPISDETGYLGTIICGDTAIGSCSGTPDSIVGADAITKGMVEIQDGDHFGASSSTLTLNSTFEFSVRVDDEAPK